MQLKKGERIIMSYIRILVHKEDKTLPAAPAIITDNLQFIFYESVRCLYDGG